MAGREVIMGKENDITMPEVVFIGRDCLRRAKYVKRLVVIDSFDTNGFPIKMRLVSSGVTQKPGQAKMCFPCYFPCFAVESQEQET